MKKNSWMRGRVRRALWVMMAAGMLAGLAVSSGGCSDQNKLWGDADPSTDWRLHRYYDDDSAKAGTASMHRDSDMGFSIPGLGGGGDH